MQALSAAHLHRPICVIAELYPIDDETNVVCARSLGIMHLATSQDHGKALRGRALDNVWQRRLAWFEAQPELEPERLVFIDETGAST